MGMRESEALPGICQARDAEHYSGVPPGEKPFRIGLNGSHQETNRQ
jgi:hypothetical protein